VRITLDEKRGIAYLPLGSPTYALRELSVALSARSLRFVGLRCHLGASAGDGKTRGACGGCCCGTQQAGFLYVFDRVTGKPLWPIVEQRVPQPPYRENNLLLRSPFQPRHLRLRVSSYSGSVGRQDSMDEATFQFTDTSPIASLVQTPRPSRNIGRARRRLN